MREGKHPRGEETIAGINCQPVRSRKGLLLDSTMWQALPPDLLEEVLCKLPKSSLINFRQVSCYWRSVLVPNAASRAGCKFPSVLLYFSYSSRLKNFVQMYKNSEVRTLTRTGAKPDSFTIIASEGGLLFSTQNTGHGMKVIFVRNPLTGQSKTINLPSAACRRHGDTNLPLAVVTDAGTNSYKLVVARDNPNEIGWPRTFVYDSTTGSWKTTYTTTPKSPEVLKLTGLSSVGEHEKETELWPYYKRSVCCNGNVYWFTSYIKTVKSFNGKTVESVNTIYRQEVLKYDTQKEMWTSLALNFVNHCRIRDCMGDHSREFDDFQIVPHEGKVLLMYLPAHWGCPSRVAKVMSDRKLLQFDSNFSLRLSQELVDRFANFLEENIEPKARTIWSRFERFYRRPYFYIGNEDLLYHVLDVDRRVGDDLLAEQRIVVYNASDRLYTYLPFVLDDTIRNLNSCHRTLWGYCPSLTSLV